MMEQEYMSKDEIIDLEIIDLEIKIESLLSSIKEYSNKLIKNESREKLLVNDIDERRST